MSQTDPKVNEGRHEWRYQKFGHNDAVGTSEESLWAVGGLYPWATTWDLGASEIYVSSSSAADTVDGAGARTLLITGLDSDGKQVQAQATLSGTASVSIGTWSFVSRVQVLTAGADLDNAGAIDGVYGTYTICRIPIGENITHFAQCVIPASYEGYLTRVIVSAQDRATCLLSVYRASTGLWYKTQRFATPGSVDGGNKLVLQDDDLAIVPVSAGDKLDITATGTNGAGSALSGSMVFKLYKIRGA